MKQVNPWQNRLSTKPHRNRIQAEIASKPPTKPTVTFERLAHCPLFAVYCLKIGRGKLNGLGRDRFYAVGDLMQ